MDPNTLNLYLIAAGLNFSLGLIMLAFAHLQPGTRVTRSSAAAMLVLAVAFFGSGYGPFLPRWMTVVGTNMLLLSSGALLYPGFAAYCTTRKPTPDRLGWAIVVLTALPFWYWGLIEPNGIARSVIFSFAAAAINVRTAFLLLKAGMQQPGRWPVLALGIIIGVICAWMLVRGVVLLHAEALPVEQRGSNPTTWMTVFGYIIIVSLMTACILWMEVDRLKANHSLAANSPTDALPAPVDPARGNRMLLWSTVVILCTAILAEVGIAYAALFTIELRRLDRNAAQANESAIEHTLQIIKQADILLRATRGHYQGTQSANDTEQYIASLGFDKEAIDNIYLIDAGGQIVIPRKERSRGSFATQRDYFAHHRQNPEDHIFLGPVLTGQVTGKKQFRISRRINAPDGAFAGVVLAPLEPIAFASHFRSLLRGNDGVVTLIGTMDRKVRARHPEPEARNWDTVVDSPMWAALARSPEGSYRNAGALDGIERHFYYKRVSNLPLVMVTGFSDADVRNNVLERIQPVAFGALLSVLAILVLAAILAAAIRQRDEKDRFLSMLSHELKTPLSVIQMALGIEPQPGAIKERMARAVGDMNAIIERCLQADRLHQGLLQSSLSPECIKTLLDDLLAALPARDRLEIRMEETPPCRTDARLLQIILSNLIDNAIKYSDSGKISVALTNAAHGNRPGVGIRIANAPGTAGFPDPVQVFRKYYRAASAHGKTGSGLGLHIAAGLARKIGGRLDYQPTSEQIAFKLWIPL